MALTVAHQQREKRAAGGKGEDKTLPGDIRRCTRSSGQKKKMKMSSENTEKTENVEQTTLYTYQSGAKLMRHYCEAERAHDKLVTLILQTTSVRNEKDVPVAQVRRSPLTLSSSEQGKHQTRALLQVKALLGLML